MVNKKEEIIRTTFKYFASRGYNVSMSEIAKDVGIKTPSLYSHFSCKEEIIYLVIEQEINNYYKYLNKVYIDNNGMIIHEQLKNIFFTIVEYFRMNDRLKFWRNILLIDNSALREKSSKLIFDLETYHLEKIKDVFSTQNSSSEDEDEIEAKALLFLAMIQGALEVKLLMYETEYKSDEYLVKIWSSYENGILES